MNKKIKAIIGVTGITIIAIVCFLTGCFQKKDVQAKQYFSVPKNNYDYIIENWNQGVIKNSFSDEYLLPRGDSNKTLKKLNTILNNIQTPKMFATKYKCPLKYSTQSLYIPVRNYFEFLERYANYEKVNFTTADTEDTILNKIKDITSLTYLSSETIKRIVYLHNFEIYFQKNKKSFYREGFTKNIKDFKKYKIAIERCN